MSCDHSNFIIRSHYRPSILFVYINTVLSFWRFEVEVLQQSDEEEEDLLTRQLFTETRTFACSIQCRLKACFHYGCAALRVASDSERYHHHHHQFILRQKMNIQMFYTSSNNNGRLPEEPNGSMNWPPIMKVKMLQLTVHVLGLQNKNK